MTSIRCLTLSLLTCAALALLAPGAAVATEVWSDFNGDGFADLAIGVPDEDVGNVLDAGAVNVLYGTAAGLSADGNQLWHQDSPGILYAAEKGDRFGRALAAGDFDGDGFADLAVGADYEDIGNVLAAGVVHVLYGTAAGLSADGNQLWHQDSPGMLNGAGVGDLFGYALAAGDFDGDGIADLAIGVLLEDVNAGFDGAVSVLYGTAGRGGWPGGLSSYGNQLWHQDSYGILGVAEAWDLFGFTLAAGDFDGDGFADLAVGAPLEGIGSA
jgi:hypothetical protein